VRKASRVPDAEPDAVKKLSLCVRYVVRFSQLPPMLPLALLRETSLVLNPTPFD